MLKAVCRAALLLALAPLAGHAQSGGMMAKPSTPILLTSVEAAKLMPATVFFQGQTAPVQARNSAGVRFRPDAVLMAALVDTSGYSSQTQAKYQAFLITEAPVLFDGHPLPAGAYGVGFGPGDTFLVMDIGGTDLLTAHTAHDPGLHRPTPLQIQPDPATPGQFRLFAGRTFVTFRENIGKMPAGAR